MEGDNLDYCTVKKEYCDEELDPLDPLSGPIIPTKTENIPEESEEKEPETSAEEPKESPGHEKSQTTNTPEEEPVQFVITEVRERKHKCLVCGKTYFRACHLSDHMIYGHSTELKHKCPQCPKAFPHKRNLSMHISNVHDGGMYQCTLCEKTFTSDPYLRRHLRAHSAEKKHVCEICDKRFLQPANLREHMLVHTKIRVKKSKLKEFQCSYCPKSYKSKKSFSKHQERHEGKVTEEVPQDDQKVTQEKQEVLGENIKNEDKAAGEEAEIVKDNPDGPEGIKQEPPETDEDLGNMEDYII